MYVCMYVAVLAYSIASLMATVFDVTSEQLSNHNYSGMWKLTLLCGCIQFTGITPYTYIHTYINISDIFVCIIILLTYTGLFFLPLLPTGLKEQVLLVFSLVFEYHRCFIHYVYVCEFNVCTICSVVDSLFDKKMTRVLPLRVGYSYSWWGPACCSSSHTLRSPSPPNQHNNTPL